MHSEHIYQQLQLESTLPNIISDSQELSEHLADLKMQSNLSLCDDNDEKKILKLFKELITSLQTYKSQTDISIDPPETFHSNINQILVKLDSVYNTIQLNQSDLFSYKSTLENSLYLSIRLEEIHQNIQSLIENLTIINNLEQEHSVTSPALNSLLDSKTNSCTTNIHFENSANEILTLNLNSITHPHLFNEGYFFDGVVTLDNITEYPFILVFNNPQNIHSCRVYSICTFKNLNGINPETRAEFNNIFLVEEKNGMFIATSLSSNNISEALIINDEEHYLLDQEEIEKFGGLMLTLGVIGILLLFLIALLIYLEILEKKRLIKQLFKKNTPPIQKKQTAAQKNLTMSNNINTSSSYNHQNNKKKFDSYSFDNHNKKAMKSNDSHHDEILYLTTSAITLFNECIQKSRIISDDISQIKEYFISKFSDMTRPNQIKLHQKFSIGIGLIEQLSNENNSFNLKTDFKINPEYLKPQEIILKLNTLKDKKTKLETIFNNVNNQTLDKELKLTNYKRYQFLIDNNHHISNEKMDILYSLIQSEKSISNDLLTMLKNLKDSYSKLSSQFDVQSQFIEHFHKMISPTLKNNIPEGH